MKTKSTIKLWKECPYCLEFKGRDEYNIRSTGQMTAYCKACNAIIAHLLGLAGDREGDGGCEGGDGFSYKVHDRDRLLSGG